MSRRRARWPARGAVGLVVLVGAASFAAPLTLAVFNDLDARQNDYATDALDPPTSLAATGGTTAGLTWTPTGDTYASGYRVFRSSTSGSGYAQVSTVTPVTATSASDTPPSSGTWYYVLRSYFQSWDSVSSNQASALVLLAGTSTPWRSCTIGTSTAEAGWGDNNGYETNPNNACADGSGFAVDANTGTAARSGSCTNTANDAHRFRDFSLGVPAVVYSIKGIEVRADMSLNAGGGTSNICIQLSWNGGTSWTTAKSVTMSGTAETTYGFGGTADTWGRVWAAANFTNANFRVRVIDATTQSKDYRLDYLAVRVTYSL